MLFYWKNSEGKDHERIEILKFRGQLAGGLLES